MIRILRRVHRDERGITLMELLVAIAISTIIIGAVGGFYVAALRATSTNTSSDINTRSTSNVMNTLTRYIHAASLWPQPDGTYVNAVSAAAPTDMTFYAYVNLDDASSDKPVRVRFYLSGGVLKEDQYDSTVGTNGYYSFATAVSRTLTLGGPIASPTSDGDPQFTYLDANGKAIALSGGVVADPSKIRAVTVNVELGSTTPDKPGSTHIQNTLYLFNIGYSTSTGAPTP